MPVSLEELKSLCEDRGLPFEVKGDGVAVTYLPFADAKDRAAYGTVVIEWPGEGRGLILTSNRLFSAANIAQQPEEMSGLMAELLTQTAKNTLGSVGMSKSFDIYYFYTIPFEDNSITPAQFESIFAGMMEGISSTVAVTQQFMEEKQSENTNRLTPEQKLENDWRTALMALEVLEKRLGTEEQQTGAWNFIGELLAPGRFPEEHQIRLKNLATPVFILQNCERLVW